MIKEDNFFINSRVINQNIKKTKKIFNSFKEEFNSGKISFLESCTKDYKLEFSSRIILINSIISAKIFFPLFLILTPLFNEVTFLLAFY